MVKLSRLFSCTCIRFFSAGKTCPVLSSCVRGFILVTGSGTRDVLRFMAINMLRSSTYLRFRECNLGIAGLSRAPLKMIKNNKIPRKAP